MKLKKIKLSKRKPLAQMKVRNIMSKDLDNLGYNLLVLLEATLSDFLSCKARKDFPIMFDRKKDFDRILKDIIFSLKRQILLLDGEDKEQKKYIKGKISQQDYIDYLTKVNTLDRFRISLLGDYITCLKY